MIMSILSRVPGRLWIALAALVALIAGVAWLRSDAVADHEREIEERAAPAREAAANERAADARALASQEGEYHAVIDSAPSGEAPSGPARALACERLRHAGRATPSC